MEPFSSQKKKLCLLFFALVFQLSLALSGERNPEDRHKLLVILFDGFRWDYFNQHRESLKGFQHFIDEGAQAEWVEPVFPAFSYPAWTSISTGVYPETHGVIGNYMFDLNYTEPSRAIFDLSDNRTTIQSGWWQNSEPIWTTATRYNRKTFLRHWSRCDVPFNGVLPFECTGYRETRGESIADILKLAFHKLTHSYDLVMVYWEKLDIIGHQYGPDSEEIKDTLLEIDSALKDFLDSALDAGLDEKVNIIITSDHGMTATGESSGVKYVSLERYVDKSDVYKVLDRGPVLGIAPYAKRLEKVYEDLKKMPGVDVYKREDIPERFHYKKSRLVHDILVVAKPGYFIRGLQHIKQIPRDPPLFYWTGYHGWADMPDMRSIFFAKGPGFKKGVSNPKIEMVDIYQIFTNILNITSQPHNGSFARVSGMLVNGAQPIHILQITTMIILPLFILSEKVHLII